MANVNKEFVLAGRAVFTIETPESFRETYKTRTGVEVKPHYTYRIKFKQGSGTFQDAYFVQLLTGPDNTRNYTYLGMLNKEDGTVRTTAKSCCGDNDVPVQLVRRALARVWVDQVVEIEKAGFKLYHEGRCGRCGRALTTPESCERGIGPECWEQMGGNVVDKAKSSLPAHVHPTVDEDDGPEYNEPDPANEAEDQQALRRAYFKGLGVVGPYGEGY